MADDKGADGVQALLVSRRGTGRTLAASAEAAAFGRELCVVDLALPVSRYIGETDKHIDEVLGRAEQSGLVLFFDEADALFGRRGEVREASDRYANLETAHLLGRIEKFRGVVVLATSARPADPPDWVSVVQVGDDDR
jgi:SpoVK/Ycf46/Vps4 family AAA+-type ATPase